jgi:hypothetical protein
MFGTNRIAGVTLGLLVTALACDTTSTGPTNVAPEAAFTSANTAQHVTANVFTHPSQGPTVQVEGESRLVTNGNGIHVSLNTSGLTPNHAYTVWWVIFNQPELCAGGIFGGMPSTCVPADVLFNSAATNSDVAYATGHVVGGDGEATFSASLRTGPIPGGWFGNALEYPQSADVHLVLMDHGPVIPGMVANQTSTLRGGCTDASVPAAFPPVAHQDGIPGPNTCRLVQFTALER